MCIRVNVGLLVALLLMISAQPVWSLESRTVPSEILAAAKTGLSAFQVRRQEDPAAWGLTPAELAALEVQGGYRVVTADISKLASLKSEPDAVLRATEIDRWAFYGSVSGVPRIMFYVDNMPEDGWTATTFSTLSPVMASSLADAFRLLREQGLEMTQEPVLFQVTESVTFWYLRTDGNAWMYPTLPDDNPFVTELQMSRRQLSPAVTALRSVGNTFGAAGEQQGGFGGGAGKPLGPIPLTVLVAGLSITLFLGWYASRLRARK